MKTNSPLSRINHGKIQIVAHHSWDLGGEEIINKGMTTFKPQTSSQSFALMFLV